MRRARRLTLTGLVLLGALTFGVAPALASEGLGVTGEIGTPGSGPGELSLVYKQLGVGNGLLDVGSGLAVNGVGDLYVADTGNNRVEWFAFNAGTKKYEYGGQFNGSGSLANENGKAAPKPLSEPEGIAVDNSTNPADESRGDVYVVSGGVVDKFSAAGEFLFQLPTGGISGIATDPSGNLWGTTRETALVQEFGDEAKNTLRASLKVGGFAFGFAVDSEDNFYIAFGGVTKYNRTGTNLGGVCGSGPCGNGLAIDPADNDLLVNTGTSIARYGPFGEPFGEPVEVSKPDAFEDGAGIAVNPTPGSHEAYVADASSDHVLILTSGPGSETPETLAAEKTTSKSVIMRGNLSPHSPPTELDYYFEYNTGSSCTGGIKTPVQKGKGIVSEEVAELEPNAEYTFCVVTENNFGLSELGSPKSFNTPVAPPVVVSESAANTNAGHIRFAAMINPENGEQETTYTFEYSTQGKIGPGEELGGTVNTVAGEGTIPAKEFGEREAGSERVETLTESEQEETYYYRVITTNGTGSPVTGKVEAYTKLPIVTGYEEEIGGKTVSFPAESVSGETLTEATLKAGINPDWLFTEYHFEYAIGTPAGKQLLEEGKGTPLPGENTEAYGTEFQKIPVDADVSGLKPNTPYYYRLVAENGATKNAVNLNKGEPVRGEIEKFTTESLPFVDTGAAQSASRTSETFVGVVTPLDQATTFYFQYISKAGYQAALKGDAEEQADPFVVSEATGASSLAVSTTAQGVGPIPASGLLPEETYHYRIVAKNEWGAEYGEPHTFTTGAKVLPGASTGAASGISQNAATLSGTVTTNGLQTNYGFEIGTEPGNYGPATGLGSIGGAATEAVSVTLGELQPGTTYYYRVTATNADGTVQGQPQSFTTPGFPTLVTTPTAPPLVAYTSPGFPTEGKASGTTTTTKTLTNKQKLAKALKQCHKDKNKAKRKQCEALAHNKYGASKKAKKGKKK